MSWDDGKCTVDKKLCDEIDTAVCTLNATQLVAPSGVNWQLKCL